MHAMKFHAICAIAIALCLSETVIARRSWSRARSSAVDVTRFLDEFLIGFNKKMKESGRDKIELEDFSMGGATGIGVTLYGTDRFVRRGSATVRSAGTALVSRSVLGLQNPILAVSKFIYKDKQGAVNFTIGDNSFVLPYMIELIKKSTCTFTWGRISIERLSNVTTASNLPQFNNQDVSDTFSKVVRPQLNTIFNTTEFRNMMQEKANPCTATETDPIMHLNQLLHPVSFNDDWYF